MSIAVEPSSTKSKSSNQEETYMFIACVRYPSSVGSGPSRFGLFPILLQDDQKRVLKRTYTNIRFVNRPISVGRGPLTVVPSICLNDLSDIFAIK